MPVIINESNINLPEGPSCEAPTSAGENRQPARTEASVSRDRLESLLRTPLFGVHPAEVVDIVDPAGQGRVLLSLPWAVDPEEGPLQAWARLCTLMAGNDRGTWFVPEVGDEVLVAFEAGDARRPYVVGALWNGVDTPPRQMDGGGRNDVKVIRSRSGIEIVFDDDEGKERLVCETPGGNRISMEDGARSIDIEDSNGNRIKLEAGGITVISSASVRVDAATVSVNAGLVTVDSGMSQFSGVVKCDTLITNAVVSSSYTPGAGNIW